MTTFQLEDLEREAERLTRQIEPLQRQLDAVNTLIEPLRGDAENPAPTPIVGSTPSLTPKYPPGMPGVAPPPYSTDEPKDPHTGPPPEMPGLAPHEDPEASRISQTEPAVGELHGVADPWDLSVDFVGTSNMLARLRLIGRASEGRLLSTGLIGQYLREIGESKASVARISGIVGTCVVAHPEHFERMGNGLYRYHDTPRLPDDVSDPSDHHDR